jgi:ribonuclease HI
MSSDHIRDPDCAARLRALALEVEKGEARLPPPGARADLLAECLRRAAWALDPQDPDQEAVVLEDEPVGPTPAEAVLHCDGAARGNPGPAGAGAVLLDAQGRELAHFRRFLGRATNNVAEYQALILGLQGARARGVKRLSVRLDSELLVKQLNGQYRVKSPHLKPLYSQTGSLLRGFERVDIIHVRRENNSTADRLANEAIDRAEE